MAWAEKAAFTSYFAILVVPCWADRNSTLLSKLFLSSMSAWGDTECPRVCVMGRSRSPAALAGGGNFTSHYRGGSPAQGAAALPQGFPGGNPANEETSRGTGLQVSQGGSMVNHQRQTLLRDPCAPCVGVVTGKKTQLWSGTSEACCHISLLPPHTWLFCALNRFVTPWMTPRVIPTGSLLRHGYGSFCHPDKSSVVLKPLEISLPRNEICLLLGCVANMNNCIGSGIIFVVFIYIMDACSKRSKEQMTKYLLFPAPAWCTLWIPDIDSITCKL